MNSPSARTPRAAARHSRHEPSEEITRCVRRLYDQKDADALRSEALDLVGQIDRLQRHVHDLSAYHEGLREKLDALTAYEHYAAVVTGVEQNGSLVVEVGGLGSARVQMAVHPDVDPSDLVIGSKVLVTRERNCLLKVTAPQGDWRNVAAFDRYLTPRRVLLKDDHGSLVAVDLAHGLFDVALQKGDQIGFDRDTSLAYERLQPPTAEQLFDEHVTDDFSQLGGLQKQITRIKRHIDFRFRYPALAAKYALKSKCGILLKGPPGNGKTRLARCCAGYARTLFPNRPCRFMHVPGSSDYNMWFGETERRIIERFNAIRDAARHGVVIVFFDEVDAWAKLRGRDSGGGAADRILNTFLSQIDGVVPLSNVILLYATNRADMLDPGLLRPGRTDEKIEISAPDRRASEAILRGYLGRELPLAEECRDLDELVSPLLSQLFSPNGQYAEVAHVKLSDGRRLPVAGRQLLSGAMLENVISVAAQAAAVREAETGQEGVSAADVALALESELLAATSLLAPANIKSYVTSIPQDAQPIAVDPILTSPAATFIRAR